MIGKVLDASAVAAVASGQIGATAWVTVALDAASILYVPVLAIEEVRALRPDLSPVLDDLALHPSVIVRSLTDREEPVAADVEQLLDHLGLFDVLAGHVIHIARRRGWEVMTADPGRLRRIDPDLALTLL